MTMRLLALALAAAGLSAGGFQLGTRQTAASVLDSSRLPAEVPAEVPRDHPLYIALQEPATKVPDKVKVRLRQLAHEMERKRVKGETEGVALLDQEITLLETRLQELRSKRTSKNGDSTKQLQARLRTRQSALASLRGKEKTGRGAALRQEIREIEVRLQGERTRTSTLAYPRATPAKTAPETEENPSTVVLDYPVASSKILNLRNRLAQVERERVRSEVRREYSVLVLDTLQPEVRAEVATTARLRQVESAERGFALLIGLRERDALKLTPQQVTQLQLLQSEFIRRFAPLREESETSARAVKLQLVGEAKDETGKAVKTVRTVELPLSNAKEMEKSFVCDMVVVVHEASTSDVTQRIQNLKNEIDDRVYEILNDDQGKRLRRMVALSLSPQP
jgi:hypothetical protein